jgi:hypothetical protein
MASATSKPHRDLAGYVCELRCKLGGHIAILDREQPGVGIDADYRWIVMHMPSGLHVAIHSLAHARTVMKGVAKALTMREARMHADILPNEAERAAATTPRRAVAGDGEIKAALDRFMADPENEPTREGLDALRFAFGLGERT